MSNPDCISQHSEDDTTPSSPDGEGQEPGYAIYLLTIWFNETGTATSEEWRFQLENPRSQERQGFVGIEALMTELVKIVDERGV